MLRPLSLSPLYRMLTAASLGAVITSTLALGQEEAVGEIVVLPAETETLVEVRVFGPDGQPMDPENLPPEIQARIAEGVLTAEAGHFNLERLAGESNLAVAEEAARAMPSPGTPSGRSRPNPSMMTQMHQQRLNRLQKNLGSSDDEFALLAPLIQRLQWLKALEQYGFGRTNIKLTTSDEALMNQVLSTKAQARRLTQGDGPSASDAKAALKTLRDTRAKVTEARLEAENDLRPLLTAKQELALVLAGVLE